MNAITLAPSWELINKDQDVKDLDWKDTQQCMDYFKSVSYTHLTLPTKRIV